MLGFLVLSEFERGLTQCCVAMAGVWYSPFGRQWGASVMYVLWECMLKFCYVRFLWGCMPIVTRSFWRFGTVFNEYGMECLVDFTSLSCLANKAVIRGEWVM